MLQQLGHDGQVSDPACGLQGRGAVVVWLLAVVSVRQELPQNHGPTELRSQQETAGCVGAWMGGEEGKG